MKKQSMLRSAALAMLKIGVSSALIVFFLVIAFLILQPSLSGTLFSPTTVPISSPVPNTTTVITTTLSFSDALSTYEKIATSAIHASEQAVALTNWLVGIIAGLATLSAGAAAYLFKTAREAGAKAQLAEAAAQSASKAATDISEQNKTLLERYKDLLDKYAELKATTLSLDDALQAWERGEIPKDKVLEIQQWESWMKWVLEKNEAGWYELMEENLTPRVRSAVGRELERVSQAASRTKSRSKADKEYEQRLQILFSH